MSYPVSNVAPVFSHVCRCLPFDCCVQWLNNKKKNKELMSNKLGV